eukprot:1615082-Pleurochrysis_carterae.AAC.1
MLVAADLLKQALGLPDHLRGVVDDKARTALELVDGPAPLLDAAANVADLDDAFGQVRARLHLCGFAELDPFLRARVAEGLVALALIAWHRHQQLEELVEEVVTPAGARRQQHSAHSVQATHDNGT